MTHKHSSMFDVLNPVQRLERLRELLSHPAIDHSDVARRFRGLLKDVGYRKHPYIIRASAFCRATCHFEESWFDNVSKLSYPPEKVWIKKRSFGRCNWPDKPVFYCSNETGVPVFEVKPAVGSYIVLSRWESKASDRIELYAVALGIEAIMNSLSEDDKFLVTLQQDDVFKDTTAQEVKEIDRYIAKLFVEEALGNEKIYWLTSAVPKVYFDDLVFEASGKKISGLIYPSVAFQLKGYNVALTTDFVDANLQLKGARMYQVINFNEEVPEYTLKPVKKVIGSYSNGGLVWEYVNEEIASQIWTLSPQSPSIIV